MEIDKRETGFRIRKQMDKNGISVNDLAAHFGLSTMSVYKWVWGKFLPNISHLAEMAELFGCTIDDLVAIRKD